MCPLPSGFVFFEFTSRPEVWAGERWEGTASKAGRPLHNVPEVFDQLQLRLRSRSQGWERGIAVEESVYRCSIAGAEYAECAAKHTAKNKYSLLGIDVDLGRTPVTDVELVVSNWPRYCSIQRMIDDAEAPPANPPTLVPPTFYRLLPYIVSPNGTWSQDRVAQILQWSDKYHCKLGFRKAVMYVLPQDVHAVEHHPGFRDLVASGSLLLVVWDAIGQYYLYHDQLLVIAHGVLSFYGDHNVRLLVGDLDEVRLGRCWQANKLR